MFTKKFLNYTYKFSFQAERLSKGKFKFKLNLFFIFFFRFFSSNVFKIFFILYCLLLYYFIIFIILIYCFRNYIFFLTCLCIYCFLCIFFFFLIKKTEYLLKNTWRAAKPPKLGTGLENAPQLYKNLLFAWVKYEKGRSQSILTWWKDRNIKLITVRECIIKALCSWICLKLIMLWERRGKTSQNEWTYQYQWITNAIESRYWV